MLKSSPFKVRSVETQRFNGLECRNAQFSEVWSVETGNFPTGLAPPKSGLNLAPFLRVKIHTLVCQKNKNLNQTGKNSSRNP